MQYHKITTTFRKNGELLNFIFLFNCTYAIHQHNNNNNKNKNIKINKRKCNNNIKSINYKYKFNTFYSKIIHILKLYNLHHYLNINNIPLNLKEWKNILTKNIYQYHYYHDQHSLLSSSCK